LGLYYLQSRYYNPTIGRFLNADAFVSTGQGVLGNNMFAYCLNNPIMLRDALGRTARIFLTDNPDILAMPWEGSGGGGGLNISAYGYLAVASLKNSEDEDVRELYNVVDEILRVDEFSEIPEMVQKAKDVLGNNDIIQDINAADDIESGWDDMKKGIALIAAPAPTWLDEFTGAVKVARGFYKIVMGVGEIFNWTEDDD